MDGEEIKGVFFFPYMYRAFHLFSFKGKTAYRQWNQCISAIINKVNIVYIFSLEPNGERGNSRSYVLFRHFSCVISIAIFFDRYQKKKNCLKSNSSLEGTSCQEC